MYQEGEKTMIDIMKEGPINPIKIQDNTLRDGHQSIYATRMRTEDMLPIAEQMDEMGFWAMEVWGGATFDSLPR
jgi:pyruvate carboxylase subunit B